MDLLVKASMAAADVDFNDAVKTRVYAQPLHVNHSAISHAYLTPAVRNWSER
jgi:hypothetical protein